MILGRYLKLGTWTLRVPAVTPSNSFRAWPLHLLIPYREPYNKSPLKAYQFQVVGAPAEGRSPIATPGGRKSAL